MEHLAEIFLNLQAQGAHNINLVTPGQWQPWILAALDIARAKGLRLPIVCNTGGYETMESVEAWRGYIDIWLADLKYVSSALSAELSAAPDYFAEAKPAIEAMMAQAGHPVFDADGILQKGVILRHLALPGHVEDVCLLIQRCQIGGAGDVAAHGAGEVIQPQCHAILGNGSTQNGNGVGSSLCSLQSRPRADRRGAQGHP